MLLFSEDPAVMVLAGLNQVSAPPNVLYTCVRMYPSAGAGENDCLQERAGRASRASSFSQTSVWANLVG